MWLDSSINEWGSNNDPVIIRYSQWKKLLNVLPELYVRK